MWQQTNSACVQHLEGAEQHGHIGNLIFVGIKALVAQWLIV